jgi:uncharacterized protein (TIGR02757 family)
VTPVLPAYDPRIAAFLEDIRSSCNAAARLRRDPLAIVVSYPDLADRELAGLVASTLAFGSVDLILRACREALAPLGQHPREALLAMRDSDIARAWAGFQYRYCFPHDMMALMGAARRALERSGSLGAFFSEGDSGGPDIVAAAGSFARRLKELSVEAASALSRPGPAAKASRVAGVAGADGVAGAAGVGGVDGVAGAAGAGDESGAQTAAPGLRANLLPDPAKGSACKRLFLYLRWMARHDEVDPGCWKAVDPGRLVVPMDTHMARVTSERLHFIPAPRADLKAALAVTAAFRLYAPEDPVKYDFALTRPGIDPEPGDERFGCT